MRNLKNTNHNTFQFASDLPLKATTWDTGTDSLICAFGPTEENPVIELRKIPAASAQNGSEAILVASWDALCPIPDLKCDEILSLWHLNASDTTCLVLAGGDIIVVREQPLEDEEKIEIVGSVDTGITAAAWSYDEELLAVATRGKTLLFMTTSFENIASATFKAEDAKLSKHVSVGWGKSETQFKGKRVKALRDPTIPDKVDQGTLSTYDQNQVSVSWRGDGAYVAVNTIEEDSRRMIRIFTREGALDSVTEPVDGLEGSLSWRPAGNLIAGVQRLENELNVVFFERNGLRHGQFPLRVLPEEMRTWAVSIDLKWNIDSSILAVSFNDRLQLWTMGNYHYYLKQEIYISHSTPSSSALPLLWHPENPLRLATFEKHLRIHQNGYPDLPLQASSQSSSHTFQFIPCITSGSTIPPHDFGTVAVIDGMILKLTPLRRANVPPPMALHEVVLKNSITDVAVNHSNTKIAALLQNSVVTLKYSPGELPLKGPLDDMAVDLPLTEHHIARQICFLGDDALLVLCTNQETGVDAILDVQKLLFFSIENVQAILRLFPSMDHQSLCVADKDAIYKVDTKIVPTETRQLPVSKGEQVCNLVTPAPWVELVHFENEDIAFSLTVGGTLYANERLLLRNITSFAVTPSHLIVTTTSHLLKFIHLSHSANLEVPPDLPEEDERCRNIERGGKIVAVMPSSFSLTLQMPRGNLETIYPRALVLAGIRKSLAAKDYRTAFLACRNRRVDMNILHDVAPDQFMNSIQLFIEQLKEVEYIDLFLSSLKEEDVTQTMYKETTPKLQANDFIVEVDIESRDAASKSIAFAQSSKINRICGGFLDILQEKLSSNMQNAITAYVCQVPPNIEAGLTLIMELRQTDDDLVEPAVEHICFIVDVNQVYECALGLYDLDLALLVAQQSQKDPREYLPYLQGLQKLTIPRKKFTLDDQLRRYPKALGHLRSMGALDEFHAYYKKHELYPDALALCRYEQDLQEAVKGHYAEFLRSQSRFREAAIVFESLANYVAASEAYRSATLWRESLTTAALVPVTPIELTSLAHSLSDALAESKDYTAAATIHADYLDDIPAATRLLCKAHDFASALRLCALHSRPDLPASIVDPGLIDAAAALTELLAECTAQLNAQVPRLRELRATKARDPLAFLAGDAATQADSNIPDDVSVAASSTVTATNASLFTRYSSASTTSSRKTSKNRRREERKRARGKKGSVYEEEYLVGSVARLVERVNEAQVEVGRTVEGLLRRGMWERARGLERAVTGLVAGLESAVGEVFQVQEEKTEEEEAPPTGADRVLWESVNGARRERPLVKAYKRSPLLGGG